VHVRGRDEGFFFFFHKPLEEVLGFVSFSSSFSSSVSATSRDKKEPIFILKRDTRTPAHPNANFGAAGIRRIPRPPRGNF